MNLAVEKSEAKELSHFLEELKAVARELGESKPSMASITNCVSRFVYEVARESEAEQDLGSLKKLVRYKGSQLVKDSEEAFLKVAEQGAKIIKKGDRLITCSYSSTICQTLRVAKLRGEEFQVLVAESSSSGKAYGELAAEQLKSYGIPAKIIPDRTIGHYISKVTKALVGADSILADGSLINGTPTYAVALAAKESHVPFYSLCETTKFDVRSYLGQHRELEEGFDRVLPHLITGIITEEGIIKPNEVVDYIKEMARYGQLLLYR
jgi:translation initiation factor 2B subunit (eIF-2B alpha/beta/delta family)